MVRIVSWSPFIRRFVLGLSLASTLVVATSAKGGDGWQQIKEKDGVTVYEKDESTPPVFRVRTTIAATPVEILAVLQDWRHHLDWRPKCIESRLIEQKSLTERYIYNRTDAPWPVSDRDVVIRSRFRVSDGGRRVVSSFEAASHPKAPTVDDVVRMPYLRGHYDLRSDKKGHTVVEYQVASDPGGNLPEGLVRRESRDAAWTGVHNLRRQVERTRGRYTEFVQRWDP